LVFAFFENPKIPDFDVELIRPLLEDEQHPHAKAVLLERSRGYKEASNILLNCLRDSKEKHEEKLKSFLSFAARIGGHLTQGKTEKYYSKFRLIGKIGEKSPNRKDLK